MMALLDLLGRRWTLRVVWELREGERLTFRELQQRCGGMSSSVLAQRLSEMDEAGIVTGSDGGGYSLTSEGHSLRAALAPLDSWARRWARRSGADGPSR
jgi:DNA-binding HxlR family transcriptional regulator